MRGYKAVRASRSLGSVDSAGVYDPGRSSRAGYIASFLCSWGWRYLKQANIPLRHVWPKVHLVHNKLSTASSVFSSNPSAVSSGRPSRPSPPGRTAFNPASRQSYIPLSMISLSCSNLRPRETLCRVASFDFFSPATSRPLRYLTWSRTVKRKPWVISGGKGLFCPLRRRWAQSRTA